MNKIIGFLITKNNIKFDIDFFGKGLNKFCVKYNNYNIYLWGIGDIKNYKINNKYSLSFPLNINLLDRNILISFYNNNIIIENDWLGSIPVFYNKKAKIVSTLSNFCLKDKTIHNEGFSNFCEFGYSVFEQTIFMDVKFMRYYSKLIISDKIVTVYKEDPVLDSSFLEQETTENEAIDLMQNYISDIESKIEGNIVIPTSGGYDSRILNYFVQDKRRIRSFTYGLSKDQSKSYEVIYAKKISEIYNTYWKHIELKEYNKYIDNWIDIYGFSTHLHGMYHIEFYKNISKEYDFSGSSFLSGIIGDVWAEFGKIKDINSYKDIINLGFTHGISLNFKYLEIVSTNELKKKNFYKNNKILKNDRIKTIFAVRTKLMLLSYLTQIPEYFAMPVWTPFLNYNIVRTILNIPNKRRKNRVWQKDFFTKVGLNIENKNLWSVKSNELNYETGRIAELEKININLMKNYVNETKLIEINKTLSKLSIYERLKNQLLYIPKLNDILYLLGYKNNFLDALHGYYIIKTIEKSLKL